MNLLGERGISACVVLGASIYDRSHEISYPGYRESNDGSCKSDVFGAASFWRDFFDMIGFDVRLFDKPERACHFLLDHQVSMIVAGSWLASPGLPGLLEWVSKSLHPRPPTVVLTIDADSREWVDCDVDAVVSELAPVRRVLEEVLSAAGIVNGRHSCIQCGRNIRIV